MTRLSVGVPAVDVPPAPPHARGPWCSPHSRDLGGGQARSRAKALHSRASDAEQPTGGRGEGRAAIYCNNNPAAAAAKSI